MENQTFTAEDLSSHLSKINSRNSIVSSVMIFGVVAFLAIGTYLIIEGNTRLKNRMTDIKTDFTNEVDAKGKEIADLTIQLEKINDEKTTLESKLAETQKQLDAMGKNQVQTLANRLASVEQSQRADDGLWKKNEEIMAELQQSKANVAMLDNYATHEQVNTQITKVETKAALEVQEKIVSLQTTISSSYLKRDEISNYVPRNEFNDALGKKVETSTFKRELDGIKSNYTTREETQKLIVRPEVNKRP